MGYTKQPMLIARVRVLCNLMHTWNNKSAKKGMQPLKAWRTNIQLNWTTGMTPYLMYGGLVHFYKQLYSEDNEQWCFRTLFLFPRLTKLYPWYNLSLSLSLSQLSSSFSSNLKVVTEIYFDVLSILWAWIWFMHRSLSF